MHHVKWLCKDTDLEICLLDNLLKSLFIYKLILIVFIICCNILQQMSQLNIINGSLVAQAVRRSPPTAGVPSLRLGHSMWVSWWTKRGLGRFFTEFLPFSLTTNFIPPFLHTHLIHFVSFHQPIMMVHQAWSAGTIATHGPIV